MVAQQRTAREQRGDDKKVVVRHAESGELVRVLAHDGSVNAINWAPDSAQLASGCRDNKVVVHGGWGVHLAPAPTVAAASQK